MWMRKITNASCDEAIRHWFGSFATELGLKLERVDLGVPWVIRQYGNELARKIAGFDEMLFEIVSPQFTMRIRAGVGPWTEHLERINLVVTIAPTNERGDKWEDMSNEIGVALLALYYDKLPKHHRLADRRDFWLESKRMTELARKYCAPFLLGHTKDYPEVLRFRNQRRSEAVAQAEEFARNQPPNVKPMWRREGESAEEWQQRLKEGAKDWDSKTKG